MLTPDQLAAIRTRLNYARNHNDDTLQMCTDIRDLLDMVRSLTRHNQRMSAALAQLSDAENWQIEIRHNPWSMGGDEVYVWSGDNPQQLAERALVEDN